MRLMDWLRAQRGRLRAHWGVWRHPPAAPPFPDVAAQKAAELRRQQELRARAEQVATNLAALRRQLAVQGFAVPRGRGE